MTLLTTEIHRVIQGHVIVFAADRRISLSGASYDSRPKIFQLKGGSAGLGYFGLAGIPLGARYQPMAEWLERFLSDVGAQAPVGDTASLLAEKLNVAVPANLREKEISGFHLAGFVAGGRPEFWFVRNVDDAGCPTLGKYEAREDFQRRDAANTGVGDVTIYRNGDIRSHIAIWRQIDEGLGLLRSDTDFRGMRNLDDYVDWVKFKMELIARFYERYCVKSIIGEPIDAFHLYNGSSPAV